MVETFGLCVISGWYCYQALSLFKLVFFCDAKAFAVICCFSFSTIIEKKEDTLSEMLKK